MRKITNFNHLVAMVAVFTTVMMVSCVKDVVVDSNFHGTSSEKICFGAELAVTEDEITRGGAESNRLGNHILKSGDMEFPVGVYQQNGINSGAESETRGSVVNSKDGITQFNVWATFHKSETESMSYFDNVAYENTSGLFNPVDASDEYYWPGSGNVTFVAVANAPTSGFVANKNSAGTAVESFTYTVPADPTAQPDVMLAKSTVPGNTNSSVPLKFDHIMSAVNVKIGQVVEGEILSVTFRNVYNKGNYLVDQGVWVVDKTSTTDYSVKMANNTFVSDGNNSGDLVNANNAVFMFIPQNPGDNARMDIVFKDSEGNTHNLSGSIADDNWDMCKTTNYMLSIDESFTLTIEPVGKKLDAHYVIGQFTVTTKDVPNWKISVTTNDKEGSEVVTILPEEEVNPLAKQGFWTDKLVDANGNITSESARGGTECSGSGNVVNKLYYIFVPENINNHDREITVTLESTTNAQHVSKKVLLQKYPNWTAGGFGWEVVDDAEQGKYGFKWTRKVAYVLKFSYAQLTGIGSNYSRSQAKEFMESLINKYEAGEYAIEGEFKYNYSFPVQNMRRRIFIDYSKLNNITDANNILDGFKNTNALYSAGGAAANLSVETALGSVLKVKGDTSDDPYALHKVVSTDDYHTKYGVEAEEGVLNDLSGILTYILKKNRFYLQRIKDEETDAYHPIFKGDDLKWYLPAYGQFEYFTPDPNIPGDDKANYWSSTAVDGASEAYIGDGSKMDRSIERRVIAVRRDENGYGNATATVDNTSMAGGENGEAQWVD